MEGRSFGKAVAHPGRQIEDHALACDIVANSVKSQRIPCPSKNASSGGQKTEDFRQRIMGRYFSRCS